MKILKPHPVRDVLSECAYFNVRQTSQTFPVSTGMTKGQDVEAMEVEETATGKSTGAIAKKKTTAPLVEKDGDENIVVSTRITSTDARTTAKVTAAARAKAKSSKDIEKWEDKERMTVNSNDDVLCHQLRVGEVAKVRSEDGTEVVVKNVRPAHVAIFCDKQEDITPEIMEASVGLIAKQARYYKTTGKHQRKVAIVSSDSMTKEL